MTKVVTMDKKIKPKVVLDSGILEHINKHYSSRLTEKFLNHECFSHPDLNLHFCNVKALHPNLEECEACAHVVGRKCHLMCDIHHFCLATYAYRLGIGSGSGVKAAIKSNLRLSYSKLHKSIAEALGSTPKDESTVAEEPSAQDINPVDGSELIQDPGEEMPAEAAIVMDDDYDLITMAEAARIYKCTYTNIHQFVRRGVLKKIESGGKNYVSKKRVVELKHKKDSRGSKAKGSKQPVAPPLNESASVPPPPPEVPLTKSTASEPIDMSDLIRLGEAADLYGCTYPNISQFISKGKLEVVLVEGKKFVSRSKILELKKNKRKRVSKKPVEPEIDLAALAAENEGGTE
jgi:hypothetical protein